MYAILNNNTLPNDYIFTEIDKKDCVFPEVNTQLGIVNCNYAETNNVCVIFNGILYNKLHLAEYLNFSPEQSAQMSYSNLIIYLYLNYGIQHTLCLLNGDFAFLLLDYNINNSNSKLYAIRNPIGTQPIYKYTQSGYLGESYLFSSKLYKLKSLWCFSPQTSNKQIELIEGGTYHIYSLSSGVSPKWKFVSHNNYFNLPLFSNSLYLTYSQRFSKKSIYSSLEDFNHPEETLNKNYLLGQLENVLYQTISAMIHAQSNKSFGIIDGGDIGSAILIYMVKKVCKNNNYNPPTIYNHILQSRIYKKHGDNIVYTSGEHLYNRIPHMVEITEMCDSNSLNHLISLYFVSKYISKNVPISQNIFCNIGADVLFGSWKYYGRCDDPIEYNRNIRASLNHSSKTIYLGANNICSHFGLQLCAPFIQQTLICNMLNIDPYLQYLMYNKMDFCLLEELANMLNIKNDSPSIETPDIQTIIEEQIGRNHNVQSYTEYYNSVYNEYFGNMLGDSIKNGQNKVRNNLDSIRV